MTIRRKGMMTYAVDGVSVESSASVVGPKEGQGPLGDWFDVVWADDTAGETSFERSERKLLETSQAVALKKLELEWNAVDLVMGGDLLDQIVTTNFVARDHNRPLTGLFSACAVFTEGIGLAALLLGGGAMQRIMVSAVSHHLTAERQFRFPIELGYQRPPTAAWTATAAGTTILAKGPGDVLVEAVTLGRVVDWGGKDPNDMGSAMAPAAVATIRQHLDDTETSPSDYDAIYTGDLGYFGVQLARRLAEQEGIDLGPRFNDCGLSLYDRGRQDVHNGGSGPGCSASVFSGPLMSFLKTGQWQRLLLVATGALFSPTTYQQGETIPCIAHAVSLIRKDARSEGGRG